LAEELAKACPKLVLLALGDPEQEYFADQWRNALSKAVVIGVGGSFDVWAGSTRRAPRTFQHLGLEWLYRLVREPWRFKRMSSTLPKFAVQVLAERCQKGLFARSKDSK